VNVIRRIALPCGIVGGVWGLLAPVMVLLPIVGRGATPPVGGGQVKMEMVSMVEAGTAGDALPILSAIAVMGLLGLLAVLLTRGHPYLAAILLWIVAVDMLILSLLSIFSVGLYFLLASILLLLAAIGMRKEEESLLLETK